MNRAILITMGLFSLLFGLGTQKAAEPSPTPANVWANLRAKYFTLTRNDACPKPSSPTEPWGVMMEIGYSEAIVTTVSFSDGTASVLRSAGGGFFGGGTTEPVKTAAEGFLKQAQQLQSRAALTTDYPQPAPGGVVFYFFTDAGHFTYSTTESQLSARKDPFASLYEAGLCVLHEYLKLQKQQSK